MTVICKENEQFEDQLEIGKTYFVENIKCIDNQFYYRLRGIKQLSSYFRFDLVSEIRNEKLNELGI
jgi:hypothetical protein